MAFIFVPNADGSFTEGDKQTNPDTGVEYVFIEGAWRALGPDIADEFPELDNRYVKKAGDTMTGRLNAPRIAVEGTVLESGRVFEAQFDGTTNAWINANGQVRSNFVVDDNAEFKTLTTKQYVDDKVGGADYLPLTGGTLTGTTRIRGASFFVNDSDGNEVIRLQESGFVRSLDMFRCQRDVDGPAFQARIGTESNAEIRTNGSAFFKGTVNMNSNKITNVTTPTSNNDAANKGYVDSAVAFDITKSGSQELETSKWSIRQKDANENLKTFISVENGTMNLYHVPLPESGTHAANKQYVDEAVSNSGSGAAGLTLNLWTYKGSKNSSSGLNDGEFGSRMLSGNVLELYLAGRNSQGKIYHPTNTNNAIFEYSHQITNSGQAGSPLTVMAKDGRCMWYAETKKIVFNKGNSSGVMIEAVQFRAAVNLLTEGEQYMLNVPGFLSPVAGWS